MALDAINVDPETIDQIVQILKQSQDGIGDSAITDVPQTSFGGSNHGALLGYHTHLAHQKVTEAMNQMVHDLLHMEQDVVEYSKSQEYNDIETRLTVEQLLERVLGSLTPWRAV
jgi:hypothetical protein